MADAQETTFENLKVTIPGCSPEEAYTRLCNALASIPDAEFWTDTFTCGDREGDTSELWPKEEGDEG